MKKGLAKHRITIISVILGIIVGSIFYLQQTPLDIWRVTYAYPSDHIHTLPDFATQDTLFLHEGKLVRHYLSSYSDTSRDQGISKNELKLTVQHPSNGDQISKIATGIIPLRAVSFEEARFWETQRSKRTLFACILIGFFLGLIFELISSFRKRPNTD